VPFYKPLDKKQGADAVYAASAPEFNRHLIVKLKRELYVPCGLRSVDQSEGVTGEVGIRVAQLNVIECVQEIAPELEVFGLCEVKILQQTDIRIRVTGSNLRPL
jgi:hypothetical protein